MIWTLLKQDPALRMLWMTLPASIAVALFTRVLLVDVAAKIDGVNSGLQFALLLGWINLWGLLVLVLYKSHFWARCSRMSLALPLRPKTLWLTRMGAMIAAVTIPVALLAIVLALKLPAPDGSFSLDPRWLAYGVQLEVGTLLALVLWHVPTPRMHRAGTGREYFAYALFVAAAVFLFVRFVPVWSVYTLLAAVAALAVGARVFLRLPESFTLVDLNPEEDGPDTVAFAEDTPATTESTPVTTEKPPAALSQIQSESAGVTTLFPARDPRVLTVLTALRLAHNHVGGYMILGVICLYSFLLAHGYHNARNMGPYTLFILIWVWFTINQAIPRLRNMDPLPVSRRFLFAVAALPALTAAAFGVGLWQFVAAAAPSADSQVTYTRGKIKVPPEFWEIARENDVPTIGSPWGETHRPHTYRVLSGKDLVVYNPYERGKENSPRFVALQLDRAVEAVHGTAAPPRTTGTNGELDSDLAAAIENGESTVERSVGVRSDNRLRIVLVGAALSILLGTAILFITMQAYRPTAFKKVYMGVVIGLLMLFVMSVIGAFFVDVWEITPPEVLDAFPNVLLRKAGDRVPLGTTALWIITAMTFAGCYLLVQKRFERAEIFARGSKQLTEEY